MFSCGKMSKKIYHLFCNNLPHWRKKMNFPLNILRLNSKNGDIFEYSIFSEIFTLTSLGRIYSLRNNKFWNLWALKIGIQLSNPPLHPVHHCYKIYLTSTTTFWEKKHINYFFSFLIHFINPWELFTFLFKGEFSNARLVKYEQTKRSFEWFSDYILYRKSYKSVRYTYLSKNE